MSRSTFPAGSQEVRGAAGSRAEWGQSLLETAVTLGLLLVLIAVIVNFGFVFRSAIGIANGANAGVTYAALSTSTASNTAAIRTAALGEAASWNCTNPTVSSQRTTDGDGNPSVSVTVNCTVRNVISVPGLPGDITISHTVSRRILP